MQRNSVCVHWKNNHKHGNFKNGNIHILCILHAKTHFTNSRHSVTVSQIYQVICLCICLSVCLSIRNIIYLLNCLHVFSLNVSDFCENIVFLLTSNYPSAFTPDFIFW